MDFKLVAPFKPAGDQPQAIAKLTQNLRAGTKHQVFLGVTGSGKTFSLANVIAKLRRPTLVIEPNKVLAAQTYQELQEFFPDDPVHYFVSYYDYYQPEAYLPQSDTYIEKDAKINQEIDQLRHEAVQDLLAKKKVIIVASVSCIYNLGSPDNYQQISLRLEAGQKISRREFLEKLVFLQYQRNDIDFKPGTFRVRGEAIEIFLVTGKEIVRFEFDGDKLGKIFTSSPSLDIKYKILDTSYSLFPAKFWVAPEDKMKIALSNIRAELETRCSELQKEKKPLEAERLKQRTEFDLEQMQEIGYCSGVENYSRHLEFRPPNSPPFTLLDYFRATTRKQGSEFLVFIDEAHLTCSQLKAMSVQDRLRKEVLIEYGFRLPSALDNRPLTYEEFEQKSPQTVYVSATPGEFERRRAQNLLVEQLIRPTGLLEPKIVLRPTQNQVRDLIAEIKKRITLSQRSLVITLTKRLAEDLVQFFKEQGIRALWLHSETKTLERPKILQDLREGKVDVLVGINLLREGLDLPEVSLVAILDADKEGFLRSETTLIQTMGRAARHQSGEVVLYADTVTGSMKAAINEVRRRRKIQAEFNRRHLLKPRPIVKEIRKWSLGRKPDPIEAEFMAVHDLRLLEQEMKNAAQNLDFERAARLRDLIQKYRASSSSSV